MKLIEMEMMNQELAKGAFTYDFKGNAMITHFVNGDFLPTDFKFKYKFKNIVDDSKAEKK